MLLFISGMTVGILTATTSWKNEVDKLNMQLNQMQNLVQDLHEELDMKEMLMVKELDDEGGDPPPGEDDTPLSMEEPVSSPSKVNEFDGVKANDNRKAENLELLSIIEAELQAELEMLEQNIKTSELDRISRVVEVRNAFSYMNVKSFSTDMIFYSIFSVSPVFGSWTQISNKKLFKET